MRVGEGMDDEADEELKLVANKSKRGRWFKVHIAGRTS